MWPLGSLEPSARHCGYLCRLGELRGASRPVQKNPIISQEMGIATPCFLVGPRWPSGRHAASWSLGDASWGVGIPEGSTAHPDPPRGFRSANGNTPMVTSSFQPVLQ